MEGHYEESIILFISIFFLGVVRFGMLLFQARAKVGRGNIKDILRMTVKMECLRFSIRAGMGIQNSKIWRFLLVKRFVQ